MYALSIMQPQHPRWNEFVAKLSRVDVCRESTAHTRAILEAMSGIDVVRSLLALRELGGHCDCAIVYDLCGDVQRSTA